MYDSHIKTSNREKNMTPENKLIDALIEKMNLKNDAALARKLEVAPPVISKIRHDRLKIGASFILRGHIESGMPVKEMMKMAGLTLVSCK